MMGYIVGTPGQPSRIYMSCPEDVAQLQAADGEVCLRVSEPGRYTISADGLNAQPLESTSEELWLDIRVRRAALLTACDWTQLPDVPASTSAGWASYRQELRDIPSNFSDPADVVWPIPPSDMEQQ
jgi:hypothetical protein